MIEPWRVVASKIDRDYGIFAIRVDRASSARSPVEGDFYIIESADWINVIPITPEGEVVMLRQYRHGTRTITLEIPGGLVEASDPDPMYAARRELLEETGYDAPEIIHLGTVRPNPAIQSNRCFTFLARDAVKVKAPSPEPSEELEILLVPLADLAALIHRGEISHALILNAFFLYSLKSGDGGAIYR